MLITNKYTIKDSFTFAEELQNFDPKILIASFSIASPFTSIHLQERIDLCIENLSNDSTYVDDLSKDSLHELLTRSMSESLTLFDLEF